MRADNRHTQNGVFAGHRQYLHKTMRLAVGNRAVQVDNTVAGDFDRDATFYFLQDAPWKTRTPDIWFWRPTFYQLNCQLPCHGCQWDLKVQQGCLW